MGNKSFEGLKDRKLEQRDRNLKKQNQIINDRIKSLSMSQAQLIKIVTLNVGETVQLLNEGKITSVEVLLAYANRAGTIGKDLNLITQTLFDQALLLAEKCDDERKKSGKKNWTFRDGEYDKERYLPALYGMPISIKDTFDMKGYPATIGMLSKLGNHCEEGSPILQCFDRSGLIPFVRSNVPQIAMTFESVNHIWGRACNPWNQQRAVGGSSGGEAGLISARCSPIGIGSDIGGSIRGPSSFCGIFGIKPSASRLPGKFHAKISDSFSGGAFGIPLCIGPLAKSAQDCALQLKVLYEEESYGEMKDPYNRINPFDEHKYLLHAKGNNRYRIGIVKDFKDLEPTPATYRAIDQTVKILKSQKHEVFDIEIPNEQEIIRQFLLEALGSSGKVYRDALQGQAPIEQYSSLFRLAELWTPLQKIAGLVVSKMSPRLYYYIFSVLGNHSTLDYMKHLGQILVYRQQWIKYWNAQKLDFVIMPGFGTQAVPHGRSKDASLIASYNFLWNVLETTVGVFPVTCVRDNEQEYQSQFNDLLTTELRHITSNSAGLPVCLQLVGLPNDEEKVLGFMSCLDKSINFYNKHPLPEVELKHQ